MARITRSRQDPALKSETKTTRSAATANTIAVKNAKGKSSTKKGLLQDENTVPSRKGKINNAKTNVKKAMIQDENALPTTKGKNSNAKSNIKKAIIQDENAGPTVNKIKASVKPSQTKTSVLGSKLHPTRKNNSSGRRSSILALKSPVLRDRTNTSSEPIRSDSSVKKDVQLIENKKVTKTKVIKKSSKKNKDKNDVLQVSIEKYIVKQPVIQNKEIIKKNISKNKDSVSNFNENENIQDQVYSANTPESNTVKSRKKNNLSMEAVVELLNLDDKLPETENKELVKNKSVEKNVPMELDDINNKDNEEEDKKITKKFFKHKIDTKNIAVNLVNRKNPKRLVSNRNKVTAAKKIVNNDKTFSPNIKAQRKSTKPTGKKLRTRAVKNYCEVSRVAQNSISEKKQINKETITENDKKEVPIYKTIELSQENKDKKEVYEFPDDSQESGQKVKKQKRAVRKPTVKRARKAPALPATAAQETKKKPLEKVPNKVQFKEQPITKQPTTELKQDNKNSGYTNIEISEDLQNAGDSTIAEASTIKITSDKRLEGNERINLMMTPSAPKTINSELKLFGPTNAITSQPKIQYSNMVNHSLIRHSMSPIKKEINNFDIGSPWRPVDAFSRVQKVVQSTPQINRVLVGREKKPLVQMNLNKKSISSEDTIHLSSIANEKLTKQKPTNHLTQAHKENVSPRKFGTVLSNINSIENTTISSTKQASETTTVSSIKQTSETTTHASIKQVSETITTNASIKQASKTKTNASIKQASETTTNASMKQASETTTNASIKQASPQGKLQSPLKAALPPSSFENDLEIQDNILPVSTTLNKENNILSPNKSPKKKIQTPSPFRFDRMRSSKRIAAIGSKSNTENSNSQKENKDPNKIAGPTDSEKSTASNAVSGPSDSEKSKSVILRQSNLNNFLNLDEMPKSSQIFTPHGIFDDIHSTPINEKKPRKIFEEPNVENAFGFDDGDFSEEISDVGNTSGSMIATAKDVAKSVKGKLFPNARVKSKRISENEAKKTLLKNVLKKNEPEPKTPENKKLEINDEDKENEKSQDLKEKSQDLEQKSKDLENNKFVDPKKAVLEAVSFSNTFDVLSENGEDPSSKVPDEVPLFVDLQPVHFTQPPRRSYNKRKKAVSNTSRDDFKDDKHDDVEKPKKKKKKESRLSKEEEERLNEWIKSINESFKEIENYDLVVE